MFQRLSMLSKIVLSMIPLMASLVLVSISIYRDGFERNEDADRALHMIDIAGRQEREMVKMSEALRGYLLNPKNTQEFERKKEADENYAKYADQLAAMVQDAPEILALNEEMAKFDEGELDAIENQVANLIQTDFTAAIEFYSTSYTDARKKQSANFEKLKGLVEKHSQKILSDIQAGKRHNAQFTLLMLGLGALIGFLCTWFIAFSVSRSASEVFMGIMKLSQSLLTSSESVSKQSSALSESTQEEASAVQQTASSMDEISAMIAKNEENTKQSLQSSEASRHSVDQGQSAMAEMLGSMSDLNASNESISIQIQEGNKRVAEIVQVIQEIGSKTQVIHDIVFQTRLLSFNASVEAARAGEAGKGFAVVAEEVGNLAKMSGSAAEEIGKLLTASRAKVEQVVKENEAKTSQFLLQNKQKVDQGIQTAARCQESLTQIGHSVSQLDSVLGEISTASAEQSKGIVEIENAIQKVSSLTQQNVQIAHQSSATSDELREQAAHLQGSVGSLIRILLGRETDDKSDRRAA